jgi:hypothetical protein
MTATMTAADEELAHRVSEGIEVSLLWNRSTNRVRVRVADARFDKNSELDVDGRNALDAYRHPFAYATAEQMGDHERPETLAAHSATRQVREE